MTTDTFVKVMQRLVRAVRRWETPVVTLVARTGEGPFRVLISCLLSLRTKDQTTAGAVERLFARGAVTPEAILKIPLPELERLIYPVGFYRVKARGLHQVCRQILEAGGQVPDTLEGLLELKGVGRKTANLVLSQGWKKDGICVDVHVHRISNRLGYVRSRTPEETEMTLRKKLPRKHWRVINQVLVAFGQHQCRPVSPRCSDCPVENFCERVGVQQSR